MMINLISVFADTERIYQNSAELQTAVKNTIQKQYIVSDDSQIKPFSKTPRFESPANVFVSMNRSFQAAQAYQGKKVCVLNFASATHAGGGVKTGASAQEECLCRCSTLYFAISEKNMYENFHKKHKSMLYSGEMDSTYNDDCIFSPEIVVLKSDDGLYTPLPRNQRYQVDVITCAAPNLNRFYKDKPIAKIDLKNIHRQRAKRILDIAKSEQEDILILGAFGCGAFRNPPEIVAEVWTEVLKEYLYDFQTIEFAIVSQSDKPSKNFSVFERIVKNKF